MKLFKSLANWNPSNAASFATIRWDYGNQTLTAGNKLKLTLSLVVPANASGDDFAFDFTISATG